MKNTMTGCPVQHALRYLGGKWQIGIIWSLRSQARRFIGIREQLPGITEKVLTENLRFFESVGTVEKKVFAEIPPRVEYQLTEDGRSLLPVIEKILQWGYAHMQDEKVNRATGLTPLAEIEPVIISVENSQL